MRISSRLTFDENLAAIYLESMDMQKTQFQTLMTAREVSENTGIASERTVLRWAREGKVAHVKLPNGRVMFRPEDVEVILVPVSPSPAEA